MNSTVSFVNATATASLSVLQPCPTGMGLGVLNANGTYFLVCDNQFHQDAVVLPESNVANMIGIGVGIGYGLAFFAYVGYKTINKYLSERIYRKKSHLSDSSDESDAWKFDRLKFPYAR